MVQSGVELTITTFGTLLIAGANAHDYALVQEVWAYPLAAYHLPATAAVTAASIATAATWCSSVATPVAVKL